MNPDLMYAMALQEQFAAEGFSSPPIVDLTISENRAKKQKDGAQSSNLIDPSWEVIDPTPNVYVLFTQFDNRFFWSRLQSVIVKWSKRMTTCAGICSYEGRGGACTISLSEPLLKLRPRKDLIETLLHEMIHAYLFVTNNNRDRDGHGPEFHKHMYRINDSAGTKISVYHDFHDEVRLYKTHWWRCDGPCQHRKPFFGMVKRASNRAPSHNDRWWADHQQSCGGTFNKIREPDPKTKKRGQLPTKSVPVSDIRKFGDLKKESPAHNVSKINSFKHPGTEIVKKGNSAGTATPIYTMKNFNEGGSGRGGTLNKGGGTIVVNGKGKNDKENDVNLRIDSFKAFSGTGHSLTSGPNSSRSKSTSTLADIDKQIEDQYGNVREFWQNKYQKDYMKNNSPSSSTKRSLSPPPSTSSPKRTKSASNISEEEKVNCPICTKLVSVNLIEDHVATCLESSFDDDFDQLEDATPNDKRVNCLVCQKRMYNSELNQHLETCINNVFQDEIEIVKPKVKEGVGIRNDYGPDSEVVLIDDRLHATDPITGIQIPLGRVDPTTKPKGSSKSKEPKEKFVSCPNCPKLIKESEINDHLDLCLT